MPELTIRPEAVDVPRSAPADHPFSAVERAFFESGEQIEVGAVPDAEIYESAWREWVGRAARSPLAIGGAVVLALVVGGYRSGGQRPGGVRAIAEVEAASLAPVARRAPPPLPAPSPPVVERPTVASAPAAAVHSERRKVREHGRRASSSRKRK
jgi:hypothetical protein